MTLEQQDDLEKTTTLMITRRTRNRLIKHGHWLESGDSLLNRILDEREQQLSKEIPIDQRSF